MASRTISADTAVAGEKPLSGKVRIDNPAGVRTGVRRRTATINTKTACGESIRFHGLLDVWIENAVSVRTGLAADAEAGDFVSRLTPDENQAFAALLSAAQRPVRAADATEKAKAEARSVAADWLEERGGDREWVGDLVSGVLGKSPPLFTFSDTAVPYRVRLDKTFRVGDVVRTRVGWSGDLPEQLGTIIDITTDFKGYRSDGNNPATVLVDVGGTTQRLEPRGFLSANLKEAADGAVVVAE